jgi:hypothetical protein
MAQIKKLSAEPKHKKWARIGSAGVFFFAVWYVTLHYLLR